MPDKNSSIKDFFEEASRRENEFLALISVEPEVEILGVVDASGVGGSQMGDFPWRLFIGLAYWKHSGGTLEERELRVQMEADQSCIKSYRERIRPYSIIGLRVRLAEHPSAGLRGVISEIHSTDMADPKLSELAQRSQAPAFIEDSELGIFEFDRSLDWYQGKLQWMGAEVGLDLACEDEHSHAEPLRHAKLLIQNQGDWERKVRDYAVSELLELKNESWTEGKDDEVSAEEFRDRMALESIIVSSEGDFEFWHSDGDLFWGHSIQICGSLDKGCTRADIPG